MRNYTLVVCIFFGLTGCATVVSKPQEDGALGFPYYLPKPFLLVTPSEEGLDKGLKVEVLRLPDYQHAYYIKANTLLALQTFNIDVDETGLLTTITTDSNTSAIADDVLGSAVEALEAQKSGENAEGSSELDDVVANLKKLKELQDLLAELGVTPPDNSRVMKELKDLKSGTTQLRQDSAQKMPAPALFEITMKADRRGIELHGPVQYDIPAHSNLQVPIP